VNALTVVIILGIVVLVFWFLNRSYVCNHIPRNVLESMYGIMLPISTDEVYPDRNPTAYELLTAYAPKLNHSYFHCLFVFHLKEECDSLALD